MRGGGEEKQGSLLTCGLPTGCTLFLNGQLDIILRAHIPPRICHFEFEEGKERNKVAVELDLELSSNEHFVEHLPSLDYGEGRERREGREGKGREGASLRG
jgi:hypothetical protein